MTLLELRGVQAGYGETRVLEGLDLRVRAGEAWVVLGPNGAGKSTLVRVVMGLVASAAGQVEVCGLRLPQPPAALARRVAWVPQSTADETAFTALEVVVMGAAPRLGPWGVPSPAELTLARQALAQFEVGHLADRPLRQVSGGERRRVWLARAMVQQPQLLVLDEPTAFLDVRHQVETLAAVRARVATGLGVLAVLHDVNLAAHLATHLLLLKAGRVLASGPLAEVLTAERLSTLYDVPMYPARSEEALFAPRLP